MKNNDNIHLFFYMALLELDFNNKVEELQREMNVIEKNMGELLDFLLLVVFFSIGIDIYFTTPNVEKIDTSDIMSAMKEYDVYQKLELEKFRKLLL